MGKLKVPEVINIPTQNIRQLYFDNNKVEDLLVRYVWTGCTDVKMRDGVMEHAEELIRQIIRAHNLHRIYPGHEESTFGDLFQTAWVQIEKTLYKYKARPYCAYCHDMNRPQDSCLYVPGPIEYGILTPEDVAKKKLKCPNKKCEKFGKAPDKIIYRGESKVFNLWCVRPETTIFGVNGIDTIDNVSRRIGYDDREEMWTIGMNGSPRKVIAGISKPLTNVIDIRTELGYEIGCTPEHSLMCDSGWEKAKNIKIGDLVAIEYNQQFYVDNNNIDIELTKNKPGCSGVRNDDWHPPKMFNEELSYILGLYVAEGSCSKTQVAIYNIDSDVVNALVNNNLGLKFVNHPKKQVTICCNKRFSEFVDKLGFGNKACDKQIPQIMMRMSKENIIAMIRGIADGDGHSSSHNGTVGFTSTSVKLIDQLRMLLLNLGLLTKISVDNRTINEFRKGNKTYKSNKSIAYQLQLPTDDSKRFYDTVGFGIKRKQAKQNKLKQPRRHIYGLNDKFRRLYNKYGCGDLGYDKIRTVIRTDRTRCVLSTAITMLHNWSKFSDDKDYKSIKNIIDKHISSGVRSILVPVIGIREGMSPVHEISVDSEDHSYIANGIVSHNSQVARTVILAYIKKEGRDYKNSGAYKKHLESQTRSDSDKMNRFLDEATEILKYNNTHAEILEALKHIVRTDSRPYEGIIGKLVKHSGQSRAQVAGFLRMIRLRCDEFTDSPLNEDIDREKSYSTDDE